MASKKTKTNVKSPSPLVLEVIVLAAGLGTRMRSEIPKVLHRLCGKPMLSGLLEQVERALTERAGGPIDARFNVVVGYGREAVEKTVTELSRSGRLRLPVVFTAQEQQLGTGHAVKLAMQVLDASSREANVIAVLNGDLPLFDAESFQELLNAHLEAGSRATLASAVVDDAAQYGRVIRKGGKFVGVVEYKDATPVQKRIGEYNGGIYLFDRELLQNALSAMTNKNAAGEFYLPDVFQFAHQKKKTILAHAFAEPTPVLGVNNMQELSAAQKLLYYRKAEELMEAGVFLTEPAFTYIGPEVDVGRGCVIGPFTSIHGRSIIGDNVKIGAHCELVDVTIGNGSVIRNSTVAESSSVGAETVIGPMARLRPGSKIGDYVKIGNFVELKETAVGDHTNVAHLSYLGDAEVGSGVNVGCGFITCNFDGRTIDGRRKHRSIIGDRVFIGSDCQVVAPIEIAEGTYIASGSTVTEPVKEADSLVIARTRQVTKAGYAKKYR